MVLYFTGTGNSRYLARRIAEELEMPLYDLNACIKAGDTAPVQTGRDVVLVTPTYAWRIPRVVSELSLIHIFGMHRYGGIWTGDNHSWWSHILLALHMMPSLNTVSYTHLAADSSHL